MADNQDCGFRSDSHGTIAHHTLVAQSHTEDEGPIARAERPAAQQSRCNPSHLQQQIGDGVNRSGGSTIGEVAKAGAAVFGALADLLIVAVLSIHFLVDMPRIRATLYRLVSDARRPRAILIGDELYAKVGAYVLGNLVVSVLTGPATFIWLMICGVPYRLMLGIFVALLDLILFGSSVAGVVIALVAQTVSLPVSLETPAFFGALRLVEDYLLVPKIIGRVLDVPAVGTLLAVLVGGAMLGVSGAVQTGGA